MPPFFSLETLWRDTQHAREEANQEHPPAKKLSAAEVKDLQHTVFLTWFNFRVCLCAWGQPSYEKLPATDREDFLRLVKQGPDALIEYDNNCKRIVLFYCVNVKNEWLSSIRFKDFHPEKGLTPEQRTRQYRELLDMEPLLVRLDPSLAPRFAGAPAVETGTAPAAQNAGEIGAQAQAKGKDKPLSLEVRALAVLQVSPGLSDTAIAKKLGCSRTSLYRLPGYKLARAVQREGKQDMLHGYWDKNRGQAVATTEPVVRPGRHRSSYDKGLSD